MTEHRPSFDIGPSRLVGHEAGAAHAEERLGLAILDAFERELRDPVVDDGSQVAGVESGLLAQFPARRIRGRLTLVDTTAGCEPPRARVGSSRIATAQEQQGTVVV